jgi:tetratricopeptide (TPR) repeat protein
LGSGPPPQSQPYLWNYTWRYCADAGERGIASLRELVNLDAEAFLPDLASALNNLGIRYSEVGKRQEAVAPTEEAVRIRRELAERNPAFLPGLASALNNLGNRYSEVGREGEVDSVWEDAIGSITLAQAKAVLFIQHAKTRPKRDLAAVGDLLAAQALISDKELDLLEYHTDACRNRREQNAAAFDEEWRRLSGQDVPEWLVKD